MNFLYNNIINFFGNLLISFSEVYLWNKLKGDKLLYKKNLIIKIILLTLIVTLNHAFVNNFVKGFLMIIVAIIFCKIIMKTSIKQSVIMTFTGQLIIIIGEGLIVAFLHNILNLSMNDISNSIKIIIFVDIFVSFIVIIFSHFKFVNDFYNFMIKITDSITIKKLIISIMIIIVACDILGSSIYFKNNQNIVLILNVIISLIYTVIVILVLMYRHQYNDVSLKYNISLQSLQANEQIINNYRIINHENRNQLLTIKSLSNNKKVNNYINSLIDQKDEYNNEIIKNSLKLPEGGIRGLIYTKILYMKKNNINCNLSVDKKITSKTLFNINSKSIVEICEILGVFIDNAIDEEKKKDKDKLINISLYLLDDNLEIEIVNSNNYVNNENLFKSTKGADHGYGLQLVKKIVDSNEILFHKKTVTKESISQKLVIKVL